MEKILPDGKMKRYNFDTVPIKASGFGVHASTYKEACEKVFSLAMGEEYLKFRDHMKCPKGYCTICWPDEMEVIE